MTKKTIVTPDRWRAGVKFLMGLGAGPALTAEDLRGLRKELRFYTQHTGNSGMDEFMASVTLNIFGWNTEKHR